MSDRIIDLNQARNGLPITDRNRLIGYGRPVTGLRVAIGNAVAEFAA